VTEAALKNASRYDLFLLLSDDIPYDDTWDRSGPQKREIFQKQTLADLLERRIPFVTLNGSLGERVKKVKNILSGFEKYKNFFGASL
jgi:nicotinamide riboside kinase